MIAGSNLRGAYRFETTTPQQAASWCASGITAKRGFCPTCTSFHFWMAEADPTINFSRGSIANATRLRPENHIFTAHKGDDYNIAAPLSQRN